MGSIKVHPMINRITTFVGWGLSSLLFLVGITSIASQPSMAIVMIVWGLLVFPPLWKATAKFGKVKNIAARVVVFLLAPALTIGSVQPSSQSISNPADLRDSSVPKASDAKTKKADPVPEISTTDREIAVSTPVAPTPKPSPVAVKGVNIASFKRIKTGMSYAEVVEILGKEGEEMSSGGDGAFKTVMYKWDGGFMANMNAMFQDDKLISKAQLGLK